MGVILLVAMKWAIISVAAIAWMLGCVALGYRLARETQSIEQNDCTQDHWDEWK